MDPISKACAEYDAHLRDGGEPVDLMAMGFNVATQRQLVRKLHPSSLGPGLCDRKACYNVLSDIGEIEKDIPDTPEENLGHRIGFIFQDYIAQAMAYKGALLGMEIPLGNEDWTGRADLLVDPTKLGEVGSNWLIDVKTVKGYTVDNRYPKDYHIAQLEQYCSMMLRATVPILFYVTRMDFQTAMYSWKFDGPDCVVWSNGSLVKTIYGLSDSIDASATTQVNWLRTGTLPDRCADKPEDHFMCASYQKGGADKGKYRVNCKYFSRCWEKPLPEGLVFAAEEKNEDYLPF